jgi:hypothetical protein
MTSLVGGATICVVGSKVFLLLFHSPIRCTSCKKTQLIHSNLNRLKFLIILDCTCAGALITTNRHSYVALTPTSSDFVHSTHPARIIESAIGEFIKFDKCGEITRNKTGTKGELHILERIQERRRNLWTSLHLGK